MASVGRKWAPPVLIAAAFVASLAVYRRLPEMVDLRLEGVLPFAVAHESAPARREFALFLLPALMALVWAAFRAAAGPVGQRIGRRMFRQAPEEVTRPEQFERFASTYDTIVLGVVVLLFGFHCALLAAALQHVGLAVRIVPVVLGGSLVLMGNVMPRLRPNWVAGLRTRRLLADPQLWRTAHRAFGRAFVVAGLVTVGVGAVAPRYGLLTGVATLIGACVVGFVVSTRGSSIAHVSATALGLLSAAAHMQPAEAMQGTAPVVLTTPTTVEETSYTFVRDGLVLHGTLAEPRSRDGKIPVVLIVAGSGPTDRNANGPLLNTNSYALLAWGLAESGIATLRYDKRGIGESGVRFGDSQGGAAASYSGRARRRESRSQEHSVG